MRIQDYIFLVIVFCFCIAWVFGTMIKPWLDQRKKPKFRRGIYSFVEYYSPYFKCWRPFYIWSYFKKKRTIHICDTIKGLNYNYDYEGEGRERIDFDIQRNLYNEFKTAKEVDENQIALINKENNYFRKILDGKQ